MLYESAVNTGKDSTLTNYPWDTSWQVSAEKENTVSLVPLKILTIFVYCLPPTELTVPPMGVNSVQGLDFFLVTGFCFGFNGVWVWTGGERGVGGGGDQTPLPAQQNFSHYKHI